MSLIAKCFLFAWTPTNCKRKQPSKITILPFHPFSNDALIVPLTSFGMRCTSLAFYQSTQGKRSLSTERKICRLLLETKSFFFFSPLKEKVEILTGKITQHLQ